MSASEESPKLHVDTDWKAQAQAEKERLAQDEEKKAQDRADRARQMPQADFKGLISYLASQAIMGLGAMADPKTGRVVIDLEGSKFFIDLLGALEEKTSGNLTEDETTELTQIVQELRARFVEITQLVAQQAAAGKVETIASPDAPGAPGAPGSMGGMGGVPTGPDIPLSSEGGGSPLIDPSA